MNISSTAELLDAAKSRMGLTSDYKLALALKWRHTTMSNYRQNKRSMDVEKIEEFANATGIPLATVVRVAVLMKQREKSQGRNDLETRAAA